MTIVANVTRVPARPAHLRAVWEEHRLFVVLVLAYLGVGILVEELGLVPGLHMRITYTRAYMLSPAFVWVPVLVTLIRERLRVRDDQGRRVNGWRGWQLAWTRNRATAFRTPRLLGLLLVAALAPVLLNTFASWKGAIPLLNPFRYDPALVALDQWLHLGRHPWEWLHPWLGTPQITRWIDWWYALWLFFVPAVVVWQAWNDDRRPRAQFLLAFTLCWIVLGTVLATILSSAGPCYYDEVTGTPGPYGPLFAYLRSVHEGSTLFSQVGQEMLWRVHRATDGNPYARISAMPSLHVAMPALYTLAAARVSRVLAGLFAAYGLLILVGSVHLGWHYAVDGYVSLLAVGLLWWLSGAVTRRFG